MRLKICAALAALLLTAFDVGAQFTSHASPTFRNGYYWYDGYTTPYERRFVNAYYANGCLVSGYYAYYPVANYVAPAATPAPLPAYPAKDWKNNLIDRIAQAKENEFYVAAIAASGLQVQRPAGGIYTGGYSGAYSTTGTSYQQTLYGQGVNASTVYGVDFKSIADSNASIPLLFQQSYQLSQQAQQAGSQANSGFQDQVSKYAGASQKVAAIIAQGQIDVAKIQAALQTPQSTLSGSTLSIQPVQTQQTTQQQVQVQPMKDANGQLPAQPQQQQSAASNSLIDLWAKSANASCVACHVGKDLKGGFDVSSFATASVDRQRQIVARMKLPESDPKMMPRPKDGGQAHQSSAMEVAIWEAMIGAK